MLLKENVTKVPKGNFRRKLVREGFFKEIVVNRRDSEEDVRDRSYRLSVLRASQYLNAGMDTS